MSGRPPEPGDRGEARSPRLYDLLLRFLPRDFRERHSGAMRATFGALHARARRAGAPAVVGLWLRELWDLARTGTSLRLRATRRAARVERPVADRAFPGHRARRLSALGTLRDDLQLAVRATTRHRGFFILAAMTLALGVGATTAMYSALKAVVLDPLPFPDAERLVRLNRTMGSGGVRAMFGLGPQDVAAVAAHTDIFEGVEGMMGGAATLTAFDEPERVATLKITGGLPALVGIRPVVGRSFVPDELAGDGVPVVLLSYAMWRQRFGSRRDVLGRTLHLDGQPWTIVGVMPHDAVRPDGDPRAVDLWLPLAERDELRVSIARLAGGVPVEAAAARVDEVVRRAHADRWGGTVVPITKPDLLHAPLRVLMIAVTLLLLVACVNVSNLLLQRASVRARETAVRSALGASRMRLIRQFLLESVVLATAGGLLGALLAWAGLRALLALRPEQLEALRHVRIDGGVLLFCLLVAVAAGMIFGLLPAFHGSRTNATAALGRAGIDAGRPAARFRWSLVTVEIAVSFALLVGGVLVVSSLRALATRDPGYRTDGLISIDVRLPSWRYGQQPVRAAAFEQMAEDARRLPSVQSVSLADGVPPRIGVARLGRLHVEGAEPETQLSLFHAFEVDPEFFRTIGQPFVAGRGFIGEEVGSDIHPVILAESAVRRLFPGQEAVGRRFRLEGQTDFTVVGVVRDILIGLTDDGMVPLAYWPLQHVRERMTLVVRADRSDPQFLLDLRNTVRRAEPDAIIEVATAHELLGATIARERFTASVLSTFAALTLLLAAIGLYGVLSQVVIARTREIGVRMALGADAARIRRLVLRSGATATIAGLALGSALAAAGMRVLRSEVFGVGDGGPAAYIVAAAVLATVALAAMLVPASRAARVDPMRAIRVD